MRSYMEKQSSHDGWRAFVISCKALAWKEQLYLQIREAVETGNAAQAEALALDCANNHL